ncbi:MAG TPA: ABC transporter ATP-binding protein [Symbiobacteriaceae bacterium]|nr:ABC transporter ATP-binding protein [Symbiobacteriaceae bacterium]
MLTVSNLSAGYGEIPVLCGINFTVGAGELVALVGANGAGKSTLIRAIAGLLRPTEGQVLLDGSEISALSTVAQVRAGIVQVPEGRRLFGGMTVEENLRMGAFSRTASISQLKRELDRVYGLFPTLAQKRKVLAGVMSGGEQQMCAIGRGLMAAPRLLLIDELSLGLAPIVVDQLIASLQQLNRDGLSLVIVEQDVEVALSVVQRGYVLETGRIVMAGTGRELLANPAIRASYLGL